MIPITTFEALADTSRRLILDLLRTAEQPVGDLVAATGLSQPAVSKHLAALREAGLVQSRVDGQRRIYRLHSEPLRVLDAWLSPYRSLYEPSLSALERHLALMEGSSDDAWG